MVFIRAMTKDFENWHRVKQALDERSNRPTFREREIWWFNIGINIGHEEDGKGLYATRPVLVIRKFNRRLFWGVPLTTQIKEKSHYRRIHFKDREQCVILSQLRLWDANRLKSKMGQLPHTQFDEIKIELRRMLRA